MSDSIFQRVIGRQQQQDPGYAPPSAPAVPGQPVSQLTATQAAPQQQASSRPTTTPAGRNILSTDVEVKGTIRFTGELVVDGKVEGEIKSDGNLTVGENARLRAEISTTTVVIYGKVQGNISATDRVDLKSSSEVVGDIKAKVLTIEAGAVFVGKSTVGTPAQAPAPAAPAGAAAAKSPAPAQQQAQNKPAASGAAQQAPSKKV